MIKLDFGMEKKLIKLEKYLEGDLSTSFSYILRVCKLRCKAWDSALPGNFVLFY
jgi:hypothetical protein